MELIKQIEQQRKLKGMNKATLCLFAKVNKNSYSNYLSGKSSPTIGVIDRLMLALECTLIVVDNKVLGK